MKTYYYCAKCGKPIYQTYLYADDAPDDTILCEKCARELYQKIFGKDDPQKKP